MNNLDDIFADVTFTPDGDAVFLSEEVDTMPSGEAYVTTMASKVQGNRLVRVKKGGGLHTTQLTNNQKPALVMGEGGRDVQDTKAVPFKKAPQERQHIQYAMKKKNKLSDKQKEEKK